MNIVNAVRRLRTYPHCTASRGKGKWRLVNDGKGVKAVDGRGLPYRLSKADCLADDYQLSGPQ